MRKECLLSLYELAKKHEQIVFIGSDITRRNLEEFEENIPERFFMEGIYEGHIIGMAAGMAMNGKIPYINTIATFLTRRGYEQSLLDLGLHKLPVRLIGSGGGTVYAPLGPTHITNEDISIMRAIPNMTIVAPCDADEMKRLMPQTIAWDGPMYIRLAKGNDRIVSNHEHGFEIGKAITLRKGADVLLITTGITTQIADEAANVLEKDGISVTILHMHTIKPLDSEAVLQAVTGMKAVITIEEHALIGGLGSSVAELLMDTGHEQGRYRFARIGFPDAFTDELGSQNEIMKAHGISVDNVVVHAHTLLK